jgi:sortase A
MTRRMFLISSVALLGAACAPAAAETGLRGVGTVLLPTPTARPTQPPEATAAATSTPAAPEPTPTPHALEIQPISPLATGPDAEAHVLPVPAGRPLVQGLPAKRVVIPSIGVDSKVIPLTTKFDKRGELAWETAAFAVGHHAGTAGPGQAGNMVLSGHISSPNEGNVFHTLPELKVGEGVIVATDEQQYLYRVTDIQTVTPDQVQVMDPTLLPTLTLLTCVPDRIYSHRLVVSARLV